MDIFPSEMSEGIIPYPLWHPADRKSFVEINSSNTVETFIPYINPENGTYKIIYQPLKWKQTILKNFCYAGQQSYNQDVRKISREKYNWDSVKTRFDKPVHVEKVRKDCRMAFKWAKSIFLVNRLFTFGFREVAPGTEHIYQLTRSPLVLFKRTKSDSNGCNIQCFDPAYERSYEVTELGSGKCYRIEENVRYMIVAPGHCLFSLHIVQKGQPLQFECITVNLTSKNQPTNAPSYRKRVSRAPLQVENRLQEVQRKASSRKRRVFRDRYDWRPSQKRTAAMTCKPQISVTAADNQPVYYYFPLIPPDAEASRPKSIPERIQELFYVARHFSPGARIEPASTDPCVPISTEEPNVMNLCAREVGNEYASSAVDLLSQAFQASAVSVHDESSVELVIDESQNVILPEDFTTVPVITVHSYESHDYVAAAAKGSSQPESSHEMDPPSEAATIPYDSVENPASCLTNFSTIEDDGGVSLNSVEMQPMSVVSNRGSLPTPYRNAEYLSFNTEFFD